MLSGAWPQGDRCAMVHWRDACSGGHQAGLCARFTLSKGYDFRVAAEATSGHRNTPKIAQIGPQLSPLESRRRGRGERAS